MKTNLINAPRTYADIGQSKPVKEGRKPETPRTYRVYICIHCRRGGGTLKNIGTHREPIYVHESCEKEKDQLLAIRQAQEKVK